MTLKCLSYDLLYCTLHTFLPMHIKYILCTKMYLIFAQSWHSFNLRVFINTCLYFALILIHFHLGLKFYYTLYSIYRLKWILCFSLAPLSQPSYLDCYLLTRLSIHITLWGGGEGEERTGGAGAKGVSSKTCCCFYRLWFMEFSL